MDLTFMIGLSEMNKRHVSMQLLRTCLFMLIAVLVSGAAHAQSKDPRTEVNKQTDQIARFGANLSDGSGDPAFISRRLADTRQSALDLEKSLDTKVTNLKQRLEWLGEPIDGESEAVSRQRTVLSSDLKTYQAALDQNKRNIAEMGRIENELSLNRHESRWSQVTAKSPSPLSVGQITGAYAEAGEVFPKVLSDIGAWYAAGNEKNGLFLNLIVIFGAIGLATVLTIMFRGWLDTQIFAHVPLTTFSINTSVLLGLLKITIRVLPVFLGGLAVYQAMSVLGFLSAGSESVVRALWLGISGLSLVDSAGRTFLTPRDARFDIARVGSSRGALLRGLFTTIACFLFLDLVLFPYLGAYPSTQTLTSELTSIVTLILFALLLALTRKSFWKVDQPKTEEDVYAVNESWLKLLRGLSRVIIFAMVVGALLGYTILSHSIAIRICAGVAALLVIFALRTALRAVVGWFAIQLSGRKSKSKSKNKDTEFISLWFELMVDGAIFLLAIPVFLLVFGLNWEDLGLLGQRLMSGFKIGDQHFSLMQIVVGVFAFLLLMSLTRLFQRVAERRVLSRMRVDDGIRNSLKTLIGYVGLVIAFMTGVGMIGFDLSNLAIIAGALSVGIGFGLQSIVNNFVSGLILLFERPIKVGDWVVTSSGEGIVKKISVRSTEIETFDRSSILVPNAELISSSVTNWTHKNKLGRVTVPVGVSYNEDPDRIMEILAGIPQRVEMVLNSPEPVILFTGFGDSSLDFEIRAFIADVSNSLKARTAIRLEIFKAFKAENVEIPFPQRDLHLRSADGEMIKKFKNSSAELPGDADE